MGSQAANASAASASNTPASTHSSRRARSVASDTRWPIRRSTLTHEHPVTSRIKIPSKQTRSAIRRR